MELFDTISDRGHEQIVFFQNRPPGLRAINVAIELQGYDKERAHRQVSLIYNNLDRIFGIAERDGIPSWQAADRMAEERIAAVGRTKLSYTRRFEDRLSGRAHHTTTTH